MAALRGQQNYHELFTSVFLKTLQTLKLVFPDEKLLKRVQKKFLQTDKTLYMEYTMNNLRPHISAICSQDQHIFSDDYMPNHPLFLLVGLDFKTVWKKSKLDSNERESERNCLFTNLQMLYIYAGLALRADKELVRDMVDNLRTMQDLDKNIAEAEARRAEEAKFDFQSFIGDSPLKALLDDTLSDPKFKALMDKYNLTEFRPESLMNLLQGDTLNQVSASFSEVVKAKADARGISQEVFRIESQRLAEKLSRKFRNHPLMKAFNFEEMIKNLSNNTQEDIDSSQATEAIQSIIGLVAKNSGLQMPSSEDITKITQVFQNPESAEFSQAAAQFCEKFNQTVEDQFTSLQQDTSVIDEMSVD